MRRGHTILSFNGKSTLMMDEDENLNEQTEHKAFSWEGVNRVVAILFVLGLYLIIFLKILVLE
jgi:hypothetical protein